MLLRVLVIAALVAAAGCGGDGPAGRGTRGGRSPVSIAAAGERPVPFVLTAPGTVEAVESADVGSQVGGVVTRVAFHEGQDVRAGQVLFELDPRPFRAALDQATAALERDRALAVSARLEGERARRLLDQDLLSQSEWDQKRAGMEALAATLAVDSAAVATARLNLDYSSIRAPISGRTGRRMVQLGDYVKAATSEPLVTIVRANPIRVRFSIAERDVPLLLAHRRTARVQISGGGSEDPVEGPLAFLDNAVDPATGTLLLKGELPNRDGRLVPGQFVDVHLVLYTEPRALVVPVQAVSTGQRGTYVYVLQPDSTVALRPVDVARTADSLAVIAKGLSPGERVVTEGQLRLSPGARVAIRAPSPGSP